MAADGTIIVKTDLDTAKLVKDLEKVKGQINKLEKDLAAMGGQKSQLTEQFEKLSVTLDEAKAKLHEMQNAAKGTYGKEQISEQRERVRGLQTEYNRVATQVETLKTNMGKTSGELAEAKDHAGGLERQLAEATSAGARMRDAMAEADKRLGKIANRMKLLARRVLVFSVLLSALRKVRDWMGEVVKSNSEASAALARLKGALLTLAQPLVNVIIPAFTAFVNVLTKVVSVLAAVVSSVFGTTAKQSAEAAKNLYDEQKALKATGSAAKKAAGQLASFDEINRLTSNDSGGGSSSEIAPDFTGAMLDIADDRLQNILGLIKLIGLALLGWKVSSVFDSGLKGALGTMVAVYSFAKLIKTAIDAWENGLTESGFLTMILEGAGLVAGLALAFGKVGGAIGFVVSGLTMIVTGLHDIAANGPNVLNVITTLAGFLAAGAGISIFAGSWIPLLIAGIVGIGIVAAAATGKIKDIIDGAKEFLSGFKDFFVGIFTGDIEKAVAGIGKIFDGLKSMIFGVFDSIKYFLFKVLDWFDDWTHGLFSKFIQSLKDIINGSKELLSGLLDSVKQILGGIVTFLAGVFTDDMEKALSGLKEIGKGVLNGIISIVESAINFIVRRLNSVFSITVPDWIPLIGGKSWKAKIPEVKIPRLAAGAVIPPNREFMAVLGDQKSGRNLEAPESLIRQIVREESGGGSGDVSGILYAILEAIREGKVLSCDDKTLAAVVGRAQARQMRAKGGGSLVDVY
nr:MAG TPA: minor tail protein [Caudoviricetes sp.]